VGTSLGFVSIVGLLLGIGSLASGIYWKWFKLEEKISDDAAILLRKWQDLFKGFGQIEIQGYKRAEKCVAFIEVVERTMKQRELLTSFQSETEGLMKSGFGKTYYRYMVFDHPLKFIRPFIFVEGIVIPSVYIFLQLVVLGTGAAFVR